MSARFRRLRERFPMVALGVEVFSIVLGVLLALGVNEWREARAEDELAERAVAQIAGEVDRNQQVVAERHPYRVVNLLFSPVNLQPGNFFYTLSLVPGLMRDVVGSEETLLELYDRFREVVPPR